MEEVHICVTLLLLIFSTVTATDRTLENSCPSGVLSKNNKAYLQVYGDSCFHFVFNKRRDYHQASSDCRRDGGTLALPKTKPLNDYLTDMSLNHYRIVDAIWIGLHDMRCEKKFVWEDNTKMVWGNFASGNGPSNSIFRRYIEDCVALKPTENGKWYDYQCKDNLIALVTDSDPKKPYICQYTLDIVDDLDDLGIKNPQDQVKDQQDDQDKDQPDQDKDQQDDQDKDQQDDQDKDQQDDQDKDQPDQDKDQPDQDVVDDLDDKRQGIKDQQDKDQQDKDQQDKDQQDKDQQDKDQQDKDQQDKDQQDKDQQDKDQQDKDQQDKDQQDKDQQDKDQQDKDQQDKDQQDKTVTATDRTLENSCPSGVLSKNNKAYLQVYGDSCFHFVFNKRRDYHQASSDCRRDGGTLALPKTKPLNDYLTDMSLNHYGIVDAIWIGLHDMRCEKKFVWEDNTKMVWGNFASGNGPSNSIFRRYIEDCVALKPTENGKWYDYQCKDNFIALVTDSDPKKPYICQYTLDIVDDLDDKRQGIKDQQDKDQQDKD